jgi:menaquinone-dependent protoporphyrinogen IX oxidase
MKIGILYYSRTGNTKKAAALIKEKVEEKNHDAELLEICSVKRYGFFGAGRVALKQEPQPITNTKFDLKEFDAVLVGSPIWADKPAPFIKTFLQKAENIKGKPAGMFVTCAGAEKEKTTIWDFIKEDLQNAGATLLDSTLLLKMKKGTILEGKETIDTFIEEVVSQ